MKLEDMSREELIDLIKRLNKDSLTGCYKREVLYEMEKTYYIVAMLDVNGLKKINDTEGHSEGDKLLKRVAEDIKDNTRQCDTVIRYGGDEFVIIFDKCTLAQAKKVVERIAHVSAGVGEGEFFEDALEMADKEMYCNKKKHYEEKR